MNSYVISNPNLQSVSLFISSTLIALVGNIVVLMMRYSLQCEPLYCCLSVLVQYRKHRNTGIFISSSLYKSHDIFEVIIYCLDFLDQINRVLIIVLLQLFRVSFHTVEGSAVRQKLWTRIFIFIYSRFQPHKSNAWTSYNQMFKM